MNCRICGRDCPPGARICRDCASARKRAFAATVTQPLLAAVGAPSIRSRRFAPKPARRRAASDAVVEHASRPAAALPLNVVPRKLGVLWLIVAAMVVAAITMIALQTMESARRASEETATSVEVRVAPAVVAVPPNASAVQEAAPAPIPTEAPPPKLPPPKAPRKAAPRVDPNPAMAAPTPAAEPAPITGASAPPPRVVETPRTDPLQALNEGLSRCASQGFLDRIACEQRLRSQYCGNSWGVVPQCPIGPATDHGQ